MNTYYILIDGISKFVFHNFSLACLKFDALKALGSASVSLVDDDFNVLKSIY